jgi:hypothetical protein
MERISEINAHVTTSFDELTAKLDEAKDRARQAEKLSGVIETWRTKLAEWQLSVEDGAFKLVHFRYQTIVSNSLAEAVELALSVQEKADDCQPQGT